MLDKVRPYAKAAVAVLIVVATALGAALTDNAVTADEWVNVAIAGTGAVGIYVVPNVPGAEYSKLLIAALAAGLTAAHSLISGGITPAEWVQVVIAAVGALSVYLMPNAEPARTYSPP